MKRNLYILVLLSILNIAAFDCQATIVFSDNFDNNILDPSKWSPLVDSGCSIAVSGGSLHNYFSGAGAPRGSYAKSVNIPLPSDWTSITITGQWSFPIQVYGEMVMSIKNADAPGNWDNVGYYKWDGPGFRAQDSILGASQTSRSIPTTLTDFEWTITPSGWEFKELRGGIWTPLVSRSTTNLAGMSNMYIQIGGWEYSYTSQQRTDYDNIVVAVVPEPATFFMLGLGALILKRKIHSQGRS